MARVVVHKEMSETKQSRASRKAVLKAKWKFTFYRYGWFAATIMVVAGTIDRSLNLVVGNWIQVIAFVFLVIDAFLMAFVSVTISLSASKDPGRAAGHSALALPLGWLAIGVVALSGPDLERESFMGIVGVGFGLCSLLILYVTWNDPRGQRLQIESVFRNGSDGDGT